MFLINRKSLTAVGATVVAVFAATALFASPAQAATAGLARVSGTTIKFNALMSKANSLVITVSGRTVTLDDKVALKPGKGCKRVDSTKVKCTTSKKPTKISVALGDKNDRVTNKTSIYMLADGGAGNDTLIGGNGPDQLQGYTGIDKLYGGNGNDKLFGESGNDILNAGAGNDQVWGGTGNDKIAGYAGRDQIAGDAGNDVISGGVGNDLIYGYAGNDRINGDAGDDEIYGDQYYSTAAGADTLSGGDGKDTLTGGNGVDSIIGGNGDDFLYGAYFDLNTGHPIGAAAADRLNGGANNDYCLSLGGAVYGACEVTGNPWASASASAVTTNTPEISADVLKRLVSSTRW
ncbi:calcium-binding protein [Actinoplanes palleronii]|uniref:Hemolysin type calcium-binding protein n=1 Tax=Actinoplanes palleronii TaxID=113570 RepID=A0ABQ4B7W6_9ACTN|nr:calcium-binding protein [Actinoplanes palleronii]GIE66755.1 hypothetical protein Apa02nite_028630 [Actinoplanes palleronii]